MGLRIKRSEGLRQDSMAGRAEEDLRPYDSDPAGEPVRALDGEVDMQARRFGSWEVFIDPAGAEDESWR